MSGPQSELVLPVHSKIIIMELFEFLCIKFQSSVRVYELLLESGANLAVKFPQHFSVW